MCVTPGFGKAWPWGGAYHKVEKMGHRALRAASTHVFSSGSGEIKMSITNLRGGDE